MTHLPQAHTINTGLADMMIVPERVIHNLANTSLITTLHRHEQKVLEQTDTLDKALTLHDKDPTANPEHDTTLETKLLSKFLNRPRLRAQIREIV